MQEDEEDFEEGELRLNGREGRITEWRGKQKSWIVELLDGEQKMIPKDCVKHAEIGICQKAHLLHEIKFPGQYSCSCCEKIFPQPMYECGKCDAGVCANCMRQEVATCKKNHILVPMGTNMDNGWMCNGCGEPGGCLSGMTAFGQSSGINRFRCRECDYDLCEKCCKAMCQEQNRALGMSRGELEEMKSQLVEKDKKIEKIKTDIEYLKRAGDDADSHFETIEKTYEEVVEEQEKTKTD